MLLEGILPPITTCFYADGRPYWRKLEQNVEHYSRTPLAGLTLLGSTGESVMLSDEESREVLRVARGAAAADKVLIAGVGRESVIETLRLAEYAAQFDYDAVLVRTPHFYRPQLRNREMLTYYQAVADRSPLPVLLYSVPALTAYDLPIEVIAELSTHPNIIGVKDSSGRVERIADIAQATRHVKKRTVTVTTVFTAVTSRMLSAGPESSSPAATFVTADQLGSGSMAVAAAPPKPGLQTRTRQVGFQVLTGSGRNFYACLQAGASGGVISLANFAPQAVHEIYTAWKDQDEALAAEKQERVVRPELEICVRFGIPGVKHALDVNGYFGGRARMPLLPLTSDERQTVESLLLDLRN
jgi:dihydrodipicolinate synthase/N-acetylneuraminate lyase